MQYQFQIDAGSGRVALVSIISLITGNLFIQISTENGQEIEQKIINDYQMVTQLIVRFLKVHQDGLKGGLFNCGVCTAYLRGKACHLMANSVEFEYFGAAEPRIRCGVSHQSGIAEPPYS